MNINQYKQIESFASWFAQETKIQTLLSLEHLQKALTQFGFNIKTLTLSQWQSKRYNFLEIKDKKTVAVHLFDGFSEGLKKVFLLQALGHYLLSFKEQEGELVVKNLGEKTAINQQALLFSISLLMPDVAYEKVKELEPEKIASLFLVPQEIVDIKQRFFENYRLKLN